ncbi:uncharacterized protein LOC125041504 [Penaeus chinensis]|uniref:uncharacterized protein LOC125041504 n=1 Tax=Penaeus chinensis TaxID=139456 RepID=UPI001FB6532D|nr:uncharacterized protein LOC125041504 [Penaeus chinensis]
MMPGTTVSTSKTPIPTASSSKTPATTLISTSKTPAIMTASTNKSVSKPPTSKTSAATPANKTLAATRASPEETETITEVSTSKLLITGSTHTDSMSARIAASKKLLIETPSASVNETPSAKQRTSLSSAISTPTFKSSAITLGVRGPLSSVNKMPDKAFISPACATGRTPVTAPSKSADRLLISTVSNSIDRLITSSPSKTSNTSLPELVMGTPVACEDSTKTVLKASDNRSDSPALMTTASMTRTTKTVPVTAPSGSPGKTPTYSPLQIDKETTSILKSSRNVSKPNEGTGESFFKNIVVLSNIMYKRVLSKLNSARVIVLADEDIRLSTIPDIVSRNVNEQTKNSLWILALGIYDFVAFEPCSSCKRCFTPMSSLAFRECKNSKRMKDVVKIMLHLSQKMKESVQRKLGNHGIVVVVPPIPATVIEEESFPVHSDLHKVCEMSNGYCTPSKILNCLYAIFNAYCNALHIDEDFINCGMSPHVIMQYREALNGRNLVPVMDLKDYSYVTKAWIVMMKVIIQMALKITPRKLLSQGLIDEPCPTPETEQGKPESDSPPAAVSQPTEQESLNHKSTAVSTKNLSELKKIVSSTTPAMVSMSAEQGKFSPMELLEQEKSNCTLATVALLDPSEQDNLNLKSAPKEAVKCLENERSKTNSTTKNLEPEEIVNKLKYNYRDVIVIGSKHIFEQLENMELDLPIHFIEQRIYFSDFNKFTIKEHQRKWPHHTLWVLLADLHSVLYTPTLAGPKCAAAKCQSPLLCYDLKSSYSCARVKKDISVIINRAKDFISDSREYLGKGSSMVLAPIPPDSVLWAGVSSQCTHNYIHTVSEKQLNISFLIGQSQLWNAYSTALLSEWISMIENLSLKSEQRAMLKKYHSKRKLILHFIDILKDISKDEGLLGDWNELVINMLFCLMNAEDSEVTPVVEVSKGYEINPSAQAKKSAIYPVKVQTTLNEVLEKTLSERCGNGVEIISPKPSCEEHQNTRTSLSPAPKKQLEDWPKPAEQDPRRLTRAGEGSNAQEEEGNNIKIGIPVCLEAENVSVKEPSLHERGTRWDKKTPGIRGHSCTEKNGITSGNSRLHVVVGQANQTHPQKCSVQSNSVMIKAHNMLIHHSVALEKCMLSPTEEGTFVNSFIPGSPLTQKANCQGKAAELTSCEDQEEISDAGQTGADSSLTTAVESSCESAKTDTNQQMNRRAISIKIRKIPSVSCSKGSVEDEGPQAWEVVPAVEGRAQKSNCLAANGKGNPSELAGPADKQSDTLQCINSNIPASLSKLVQPDTVSQQDCAPQEGQLEENRLTKQELPLYPIKKDEKTPTASKILKERGSMTATAGNRCWITIENINPHFKDSDVKNLLEVCGSVESLKRPVTQFDKTASILMVEFVNSCAASHALGILNSYQIFGKNVKAKRSGGSNLPVDISDSRNEELVSEILRRATENNIQTHLPKTMMGRSVCGAPTAFPKEAAEVQVVGVRGNVSLKDDVRKKDCEKGEEDLDKGKGALKKHDLEKSKGDLKKDNLHRGKVDLKEEDDLNKCKGDMKEEDNLGKGKGGPKSASLDNGKGEPKKDYFDKGKADLKDNLDEGRGNPENNLDKGEGDLKEEALVKGKKDQEGHFHEDKEDLNKDDLEERKDLKEEDLNIGKEYLKGDDLDKSKGDLKIEELDKGKGDVKKGETEKGKGDVKKGETDKGKGDVKKGETDKGKGDVKKGETDKGKGDVKKGETDKGKGDLKEEDLDTGKNDLKKDNLDKAKDLKNEDVDKGKKEHKKDDLDEGKGYLEKEGEDKGKRDLKAEGLEGSKEDLKKEDCDENKEDCDEVKEEDLDKGSEAAEESPKLDLTMLEKKSEQIMETSKEEAKWVIKVPLLFKKCIELDYQIAKKAKNKSDYKDGDLAPKERRDRDLRRRRLSSDTCGSSSKRRAGSGDCTTQDHNRSSRRHSSSRSRRRNSSSRSRRRQSRSRSRRRSCSPSSRSGSGSQERSWSSRRKLDEEEWSTHRKWREGESPRQRKTARCGESKSNYDSENHGYNHRKRKDSNWENSERSSRSEGSLRNSSEWSRSGTSSRSHTVSYRMASHSSPERETKRRRTSWERQKSGSSRRCPSTSPLWASSSSPLSSEMSSPVLHAKSSSSLMPARNVASTSTSSTSFPIASASSPPSLSSSSLSVSVSLSPPTVSIPTVTPAIVSTDSGCDSGNILNPDIMKQLERAEEDMKNDLVSEYQVFQEVPEIHPQFEEVHDMFTEEYKSKFGDVLDSELCDTIWKKFWKEVLQEKQESEYQEKLEVLRQQYKALDLEKSITNPSKDGCKASENSTVTSLQGQSKGSDISCMNADLVKCSLLQAFALLEELSEFLGIFAPAMKMLMEEVVKLGVSSKEALEVLSTDDNNILIKMVSHKLLCLSKAVESPLGDKLLEGSTETLKLLQYSVIPPEVKKSFNGVDVEAVARSSHGKDVPSTIEMIKKSLEESGFDSYSAEDVHQIYLAVSHQQFDMASWIRNSCL